MNVTPCSLFELNGLTPRSIFLMQMMYIANLNRCCCSAVLFLILDEAAASSRIIFLVSE
jgi:hypothetical protein